MTKFASMIIVSAFALSAQAVQENDSRYFELTKVKTEDVTAEYNTRAAIMSGQPGLVESCSPAEKPLLAVTSTDTPAPSLDPLSVIEVTVDRIINIGKKIWGIMDAGRPVINVTSITANALPQGLTCWSDLAGWNVPESKVYRVTYENGFGADVVRFAYRVSWTAGGNLDGVGKYLTNANIAPADVHVSWGFNLNASGEVPSVFNTGTKEKPVAGMQMLMKWQVKSVVTEKINTESFYVGGDNMMKKLE